MGWRATAIAVATLLVCQLVSSQRILIKHDAASASAVAQRGAAKGLERVLVSKGLTVLERRAETEYGGTRKDRTNLLLKEVHSWPGVQAAEEDQPR
jgi:hypothetical protein